MNKVQNNSFNNSWYKPGGSFIKRALWYWVNVVFFNSYLFPFSKLKVFLLRLFGSKVGKGVVIKPKVNIKNPWRLIIGDYSWIGEEVWIDNLEDVNIGPNCCISQGAMILTGNHNYTKTTFDLIAKPINLDEGSWVGAKSVVCPGVNFGSHAILTVGSIATKNLEPYGIYQGNPVVKIKERVIQ